MMIRTPSPSGHLIDVVCPAFSYGRFFAIQRRASSASSAPRWSCSSVSHPSSFRCAVLGAGFAGLSVAWHLLIQSSKELKVEIDIFDEFGIGGGASGVAGGLLHPYSPKVKLLWKAEECWKECLNLLNVAEEAARAPRKSSDEGPHYNLSTEHYISRRRGILRPALTDNNLDAVCENAKNCLSSCRVETIDKIAARDLIPNLCTPLNTAFFMPEAVNVNPQNYLEALLLACGNFVKRMSSSGFPGKDIRLHKKFVASLHGLEDEYDAVVVCLGARVDMLPELSGILPLRTCRGIVAHLQLSDDLGGDFPDHSPSILSDAWIAIQGPRNLCLGSTWEWGSRDHSPLVSSEEASRAMQDLLPKACVVYPQITNWVLTGARAGLRAMPSRTPQGSFPLLGCIDDLIGRHSASRYWLIGGLGSRGLLYHGWLGKLTAQAVLSCNEDVIPPELTSWRKMRAKV